MTTVLATTLVGEQIGWLFAGGGVLVLAGVWFGALLPPRPSPAPAAAATPRPEPAVEG